MQVRKLGKTGLNVSALGFGMMRLPVDENGSIKEEETIRMLRDAIDHGVNYVDTAYPYHGGMSEVVTGKALQDGYRGKVTLATKLPVWLVKSPDDFDRFLDEQLQKLGTDHIDCYLFHGLSHARFNDIVLKYGLLGKAEQAIRDGRIRHLGFSFHDDLAAFKEIIDGYDKWDFCQMQLNYINTDYQAGLAGLQYAAGKGLGVIVMEPCYGGKLANPPREVADVLDPSKKPVEWAFDFLWNRPEVSLTLSGMSTYEQVEENLAYADRAQVSMLSDADLAMLTKAKEVYDSLAMTPCTNCKYCMPCPFGLEIPKIFEIYNEVPYISKEKAAADYAELAVGADHCHKCHRCEGYCPQHIKISEKMTEVAACFAK